MNKCLPKSVWIAIAILLQVTFGGVNTGSAQELSLMTWNIWHGGLHGPASEGYAEDSTYTELTTAFLKRNAVDVLCMQETYCCGMQSALDAGFAYSAQTDRNLSIHSRYPIVEEYALFNPFNSFGVRIDFHGMSIGVFNVWLHYLPDNFTDSQTLSPQVLIEGEKATRGVEIVEILEGIDSIQKLRHFDALFILGDFNGGSHLDWTPLTRKDHFGKVVEWPVSKTMLENGFRDTFRAANKLKRKEIGTWGYTVPHYKEDRIDYIYVRKTDPILIRSVEIIPGEGKDTLFNSDHRAVRGLFELTK